MRIEINTNNLELFINSFGKIRQITEGIHDRFKEIKNDLVCGNIEDVSLLNKVQDLERALQGITCNSVNYSDALNKAIQEYLIHEGKITVLARTMYSGVYTGALKDGVLISGKDNMTFGYIRNSSKGVNIIMNSDDIKSSNLPDKDLITRDRIRSGDIQNGKNLIVRTLKT